jgi:4-methyl-5(b-hydroxyethyl)-thiazole monophosphate biosynthesis
MIYVHLAEGFEEIEAITVVDVLRRSNLDVKTVSVTGDKIVKGAHDIKVQADLHFEEADYDSCEMIVLPGGMPGTNNLADHKELINKIKEFNEKKKWLAAICAAPMIFGNLSMLEGRKATIYPGREAHILGGQPTSDNVVVDGHFITSKGPKTAMEFAIKIVEVLKGEEDASEVRKALLYD